MTELEDCELVIEWADGTTTRQRLAQSKSHVCLMNMDKIKSIRCVKIHHYMGGYAKSEDTKGERK